MWLDLLFFSLYFLSFSEFWNQTHQSETFLGDEGRRRPFLLHNRACINVRQFRNGALHFVPSAFIDLRTSRSHGNRTVQNAAFCGVCETLCRSCEQQVGEEVVVRVRDCLHCHKHISHTWASIHWVETDRGELRDTVASMSARLDYFRKQQATCSDLRLRV